MTKSLLCLSAVVALAGAAAAEPPTTAPAPAPMKVTERIEAGKGITVATLANGLTVIVKPVRTAPVVCVQAYVRAGSIYEGRWAGCGLSHLLEHLVAKNATHDGQAAEKPEAERGDRVDAIGGQSNAYTSLDVTCYYISAAASKTNDCIDLIADWMTHPNITAKDFKREHGVVQRELETDRDDPAQQMWDMHGSNLFGTHPASLPIIGHAAALRDVTLADVLAYHRKMYTPQNMVFCVVGDVDAAAAMKRICRAFAGFEQRRAPDLQLPDVAAPAGTRHVVRQHPDIKDVMVRMSFQTIPLIHPDLYALDVLSYVLTNGQSSRLVQTIQREAKLVTSISSSSWTPEWGTGAFSISFRAKPDQAPAAERAILKQLRAVVASGVTGDQLARAKRQKVSDHVYSQQTAESIANTLAGDYLSTGDVNFSANYTKRIQAVMAEQVQAAAKKYFRFGRVIVSRLEPKSDRTNAAVAQDAARGKAVTFTLPNGLRVVLQPTDAVGLVSMAFATPGGVMLETEQTNGLGSLMAALSTKGAGARSAEQIAAFFDGAGGDISGTCGNNSFLWEATVLDDSFPTALDILADVVRRPTLSDKELDILRPTQLAGIRRIDEDWFAELNRFFRGKFYTGSPYRLLSNGTEKVVSAATAKQVAAHHRTYIRAGASVLTVYGNFDAAAARKKVEALFADLPGGKVSLPVVAPRKVAAKGEMHVLETNKQMAGVIVAAPGMKVTNLADRLPLTVLDTIISGFGLPSGWLHRELRGKQLVYVVHAYNWAGMAPGAFMTYAACQPDKADTVVEIILRNLRKAADYTPTQKEVDRAVNTILTAELLGNQSMSELATGAALDELYGFGYDFRSRLEEHYRKITPADVARVAKKYLSGGYVVAIAKPKPAETAKPKTE